MKPIKFWKTPQRWGLTAVCAIALFGGLAVARETFEAGHIDLKLADANEGPSRLTMAPAAKRAMPSVVKISASKMVKTQASAGDEELDPLFRQFFDNGRGPGSSGEVPGQGRRHNQQPEQHREGGLGSGVIMDCCPKCQGVWLDRGELEKIRAALYSEPARPRVVARQPVPQHIIVNFEVMQQVHDLQARPRA